MKAVIAIVVSMAAALWAGPAGAQRAATAEQLFEQGRELMEQGEHEAACDKFEASHKIDPALGTLLNLALCYEEVGKLASAWGHFREVENLARRAKQTKRQAFAREHAEALEPRLPRLVIEVPQAVPELAVTRNGEVVEAALFGEAAYVDPGEHEIEASAPGYQTFRATVTAVEAGEVTVTIPELEADAADQDVDTGEGTSGTGAGTSGTGAGTSGTEFGGDPSGDDTSDAAGGTRRWIGLGVGGAGVAALAAGLGFGWSATSTWNDAIDSGQCNADTLACTPEGQDKTDTARTHATLSNVLVGAGVAMAAAGAVIYLTAPDAGESERATKVTPVAGPEQLGVAVTGRF